MRPPISLPSPIQIENVPQTPQGAQPTALIPDTRSTSSSYALVEAHTTYGRLGVKVWIMKGEVYGKRELSPLIGLSKKQGGGTGDSALPTLPVERAKDGFGPHRMALMRRRSRSWGTIWCTL